MIPSDEQRGAGAWRFDGLTRVECLAVLARVFGMKATAKTFLGQEKPGSRWTLYNCLTLEGQKKTAHCFGWSNQAHRTELEALQWSINFYATEFDRACAALEREAATEAAQASASTESDHA
jgi:hypothetical protein